jgi:hypothetical protein
MLLVLASYFEPENHGTGRKIGISPGKPRQEQIDEACDKKGVETYSGDAQFLKFSPGEVYWDYHKMRKAGNENAGSVFREKYKAQLDGFFNQLKEDAKDQGKEPTELLPFQDGDTLLTWERKGNLSYRAILAGYLRDIGYDVEEN